MHSTLFSLSGQTSPLHLFFPSSSSSISYTTLHSQGFCYIHLPVWITVCIVAVNGVSLRSQDTVTVGFRSCFPHWGCALCVRREGRSLSDGLPQKLSSTGSSPLLVMCGATGSSCGKSCPTERGLTGTWLIKMYVFNWSLVIIVIAFWFLYFSSLSILFLKQCVTTHSHFYFQSFITASNPSEIHFVTVSAFP